MFPPTLKHFQVATVSMVSMVEMVKTEETDVMDCLVLEDPKDLKENLVQVDLQDLKARQELGEQMDHKDALDQLDQRVTYTRWGKSSCPDIAGTELVYTGRAGGANSISESGGPVNFQCMPLDPEYTLPVRAGVLGHAYIYDAEYILPLQSGHRENVPCAVCYVSTREAILMIPAKTRCPTSWTREYYGYLMAEAKGRRGSTIECVDEDQESVPGSSASTSVALLHHVEVSCTGIPCPPYDPEKELTCVVCTK